MPPALDSRRGEPHGRGNLARYVIGDEDAHRPDAVHHHAGPRSEDAGTVAVLASVRSRARPGDAATGGVVGFAVGHGCGGPPGL